MSNNYLRTLASAVAGSILPPIKIRKIKPLDYYCLQCGDKIPPGKLGRKCKKCRSI